MKQNMNLSERLLRGTGIVMSVFGALETVVFIVLTGGLIVANSATVSLFSGTGEIIGAAAFLATALLELITGILGARCAKNGASETVCIVFGVLCLGLTILSLIMIGRKFDLLSGASLAICAILPIIYIFAAFKTQQARNAAEEPAEEEATE